MLKTTSSPHAKITENYIQYISCHRLALHSFSLQRACRIGELHCQSKTTWSDVPQVNENVPLKALSVEASPQRCFVLLILMIQMSEYDIEHTSSRCTVPDPEVLSQWKMFHKLKAESLTNQCVSLKNAAILCASLPSLMFHACRALRSEGWNMWNMFILCAVCNHAEYRVYIRRDCESILTQTLRIMQTCIVQTLVCFVPVRWHMMMPQDSPGRGQGVASTCGCFQK